MKRQTHIKEQGHTNSGGWQPKVVTITTKSDQEAKEETQID